MSFVNLFSRWMDGQGPESDIVISSRIRLARNLNSLPFPRRADLNSLQQVIQEVEKSLQKNNSPQLKLIKFASLPLVERQILVEKHLISPQHGQNEQGALLLNEDGSLSVMINEEDHLRIQCILPGLQLTEAWRQTQELDDDLTRELDIAYDEDLGYLTCCPTNVGTGLRASVMIHLPALAYLGRLEPVLRSITKVGLAVRGTYGEGTEARGNIFQISNQVTLGRNEEEILDNIQRVTTQIVEHEKNARDILVKSGKVKLKDLTGRAYGVLANAYVMTSTEAMKLLSDLRLGVDLGLVEGLSPKLLNQLLVLIYPAHLQRLQGKDLEEHERDFYRAALLRENLRKREE